MMDRTSRRQWLVGIAIVAAIVGSDVARAQRVNEAEIRLRDALHKEQVEGKLAEAIALYERIASDKHTPRGVAAQALLNLGRCHERLGSREAQRAYERIVQQFADQAPATEARSRLAALRVPVTRTGGINSSKLATAGRLYSQNVSADGRFVVASTDEGFGVVDLTTGVLKRLPFDPGRQRGVTRTVISPDGKRVAYPGWVNGAIDFRVMNVDGSGIRIVKFPADYSGFAPMDWSRDGRTIVGMMFKPQPTPDAPRPLPSIATVDLASGKFTPLDDALAGLESPGAFLTALRLSPDGNFVAFVVRRPTRRQESLPTPDEAGDIYTMRVDGRDRQRLALGEELVELVGWLPDGQGIAFVSEPNSVRTMFAIPIQGGVASGASVTMFRGVGRNRPLGLTTSGALIYAVDGRVLKSYIADLRTSPPVRTAVNASDREWDMSPSWSPDGRSLAFVVAPPFAPDDAELRLVVRDMATQTDRVLLRWQGSNARGGSWTADGTAFVLSRRIGRPTFGPGGIQIDRVDVATGTVHPLLAPQEAPSTFPRLAPDGRYLYFVAGGSRLIRVDLQANERTELASIADWYDLSSDGAYVAYVQTESSAPVLKLQRVDGGPVRVVMRFPPEDQINSVAFDTKDDWLYVAKASGGSSQIIRVRLSGQPTAAEGLDLHVTSFPDISVHPDGRRLAFIDNQWSVDFWQMNGLVDAFRIATRRAASGSSQPGAAPAANR